MRLDELLGASNARAARWEHLTLLAVPACVAAATVLLFVLDPAKSRVYPVCPFHALTGLHCPGCGSLRALHQLLHGNVAAAFGLNALVVLSLPFMGYAAINCALRLTGRRPLPAPLVRAGWIWTLLGVVVLFGVLRNLPAWPFRLLAP